jgi:exodeoxyribonuclease V alpha subunit
MFLLGASLPGVIALDSRSTMTIYGHARELSMAVFTPTSPSPFTHPTEQLTGAVERVTFHSEETGFCVLRVKVRGHRDLVTVVGTAATITPGEYIEGQGVWVNDRTHGLQFKTQALRVVPPSTLEGIRHYRE